MHIRLTLAGSGGGATPTDVMVMASEPTTVRDLRSHLVPWLPQQQPLYADGRPLSDDDVLGAPPLVHGAVLSDASANLDDEVLQGVLQIRVVGGPCAGAVHRVVPGEITVGRAAGNVVRIDDPDVSRVHVSMTSDASGLYVRDRNRQMAPSSTMSSSRPMGCRSSPDSSYAPATVLSPGHAIGRPCSYDT